MSRFAPDRRQARCGPWPCRLGWQGESCPGLHPTVDRLDGWPKALQTGLEPTQCLMRLEEALKDNRSRETRYLSKAIRPTGCTCEAATKRATQDDHGHLPSTL